MDKSESGGIEAEHLQRQQTAELEHRSCDRKMLKKAGSSSTSDPEEMEREAEHCYLDG